MYHFHNERLSQATLSANLTHAMLFPLHFPRPWCKTPSVGNTNDTARRTWASVASLLGLFVSALAEVVGAGVDDDGALG
jgi:hypothetical protein